LSLIFTGKSKKECIVNEKGTGSSKNDTNGYCSAT
jgi:hypothetical protein